MTIASSYPGKDSFVRPPPVNMDPGIVRTPPPRTWPASPGPYLSVPRYFSTQPHRLPVLPPAPEPEATPAPQPRPHKPLPPNLPPLPELPQSPPIGEPGTPPQMSDPAPRPLDDTEIGEGTRDYLPPAGSDDIPAGGEDLDPDEEPAPFRPHVMPDFPTPEDGWPGGLVPAI
ncbi:MAG: hypothetical protein WDW36_006341 [Sanguina aurantia]